MSTMKEYFNFYNQVMKEERKKKEDKYVPRLEAIGAIKKSPGIYDYQDWLCYPTKGFAMNKYDFKYRIGLEKLLERYERKK